MKIDQVLKTKNNNTAKYQTTEVFNYKIANEKLEEKYVTKENEEEKTL